MRLFSLTVLLFLTLITSGRTEELSGKIWDVQDQSFISRDRLIEQLNRARFVLLGEIHDNKLHHDRQAGLLDKLTGSDRKRAVVFEMAERSKQNAFAIFRSRFASPEPGGSPHRHDASGLEVLLDWEHSGWPDWTWYKPLFDIAMEKELPIGAGGLSHHDVGAVHKQGLGGLPADLRAAFSPYLNIDWPDELEQQSQQEIMEGHCNALPDRVLPRFSLIQRLRDASLSQSLVEQAGLSPIGKAILIAGNSHVRRDLGVPYYLVKSGVEGTVLSVGQVEVQPGLETPTDYAAVQGVKRLPYDFVIFSEATDRDNPCAVFNNKGK